MALVHFDGFDLGDYAFRYVTSSISTTSSTRFSTGLAATGTGDFTRALTAADDEVYFGIAVNVSASIDTNQRALLSVHTDAGATRHITVGLRANGVEVRLGTESGTLLSSYTSASFNAATWYYMEVYVKVANSGGRATVKVDGNTLVDFTGDTQNGGTSANVDMVRFAGNGVSVSWDDLYICDATGSAPYNTFLGDVRVATLAPTGAGTTTEMTASTGSNWQTVDERPYSATDYNTGSTGQMDTYAMSDLPAGVASVLAVQAFAIAKKTDAGALSLHTVVRSGSTNYLGTDVSLGLADALVSSSLYTTDPNTSAAWTTSGVNALEAGAEAA